MTRPNAPRPYLVTVTMRQRRNPGLRTEQIEVMAHTCAEAIAAVKRNLRATGWTIPRRAPKPKAVRGDNWYFLKSNMRFVGPDYTSGRIYPVALRVQARSKDEAKRLLMAKIAAANRRSPDRENAWRLGEIRAVLMDKYEVRIHMQRLAAEAARATQTHPQELAP